MRVQDIIDENLGTDDLISLDAVPSGSRATLGSIPPEQLQEVVIRSGILGRTVAREKAKTIHAQRRAVQALGPRKLKTMIRGIFHDVATGNYNERDTARRFGLGNATLNRFAGLNWAGRCHDGTPRIPDLWRNTASVLGGCPAFREAVTNYGLREKLNAMIGSVDQGDCHSD